MTCDATVLILPLYSAQCGDTFRLFWVEEVEGGAYSLGGDR